MLTIRRALERLAPRDHRRPMTMPRLGVSTTLAIVRGMTMAVTLTLAATPSLLAQSQPSPGGAPSPAPAGGVAPPLSTDVPSRQPPRDIIRRFTQEQWDGLRSLFALVEQASVGETVPADVPLTWTSHLLKADAGVNFTAFTLKAAVGDFTSFPVAMYLRVVTRGLRANQPGPLDPLAQYPFEDATFFDKPEDGRFTRGFLAPPGRWDVYVALREAAPADGRTPKTVVFKRQVDVPDLSTDLSMSSIILADKVEADPDPPAIDFEAQLDAPYTLWGSRVTPTLDPRFYRSGKLSLMFAIYNVQPAPNDKPDVEVEYHVYQRIGGRDAPFGDTRPQVFNAQTLPALFSLAAGNLIIAGQDIPLQRFGDGAYRLEIKVTDKTARASVTRDVTFSVVGP